MPWWCLSCFKPQSADIKQLHYEHFTLHDVPAEVFAFERTLEELHLDSNRIRDLPRPLFHCHGLKVLTLSDNEVISLPPAIASLINLQKLDVSRNNLNSIPDNLKGCKHLTHVDVSVNPLEKLPEGFTQLISLEELYLNDTYLDFLPANFGRLLKLRILELRENNLNTLPKSIARLTHLQRLDIGQNDFSDLPEVIGSLHNLTELWFDSNRIKCVPPFIGNLKKLVHLEASNNNIGWIAPEIEHCTKLIDLTVSCNELHDIPDTIGNLKELTTLKLEDNQITTLPNSIGKLSYLEELNASQNDLESLTPCIGLLRKLRIINIDCNMLEELPSEIGSCTSLTILSVHSNKLQHVPAELGHLCNLRVINLSENQLQSLPVSVLNLVQLTALWLSNNQSTPLTTLQQEVDKETGQTVCINFMLPQSSQEMYFHDSYHGRHDIHTEQPAKSKPHITFASDAEVEAPSRLMRAPTPYPKELRAMAKHARAIHHPRRSSRESDEDMPLLGEMISQEPKDVLIKEAKVKKPSTASLGESLIKNSSSEKTMEITETKSEYKGFVEEDQIKTGYDQIMYSVHNHEEVVSPVVATDSGPIVREAKCVRKNTTSHNTLANVLIPPDVRQRYSLASNCEPVPQQPPPYHIAAAFSKQAVFFRQAEVYSPGPHTFSDEKIMPAYEKRDGFEHSQTSSVEPFNYPSSRKYEETSFTVDEIPPPKDEGESVQKNKPDVSLAQYTEKELLQESQTANERPGIRTTPSTRSSSSPTEESYNAINDSSLDLTQFGTYGEDDSYIEVIPSDASFTASDILPNTTNRVETESQECPSIENTNFQMEAVEQGKGYSAISLDLIPMTPSKTDIEVAEQDSEAFLMQKPRTFTQDKPVISEGVIAPTPHRPGSPSTTPIESLGYMSSLSSVTSAPNSTPHRKASGIPKSLIPKVGSLSSAKQDPKVDPKVIQNYWEPSGSTRIPLPGFYSNSPSRYNSSRRSSISSSTTRPGSIASSCDTPCSISEAGRNYLNKPKILSSPDYNLNMPQKHLSGTPEITNINESIYNESENKVATKIPVLAFPRPEVPISRASKSVQPMQSRIPAPSKLPTSFTSPNQKTCIDLHGKNAKVWMFGPHKNATVFPVIIHKNPGLGFSISGGAKTSTVEKYENEIFVTKVHPNGPASNALLPGDKILEVDGVDFTKLEHDQAVCILKQSSDVVNMMISRQQT